LTLEVCDAVAACSVVSVVLSVVTTLTHTQFNLEVAKTEELPATGFDLAELVAAAFLFLVLGGFALLAVSDRRRNTRSAEVGW